MTKQRTREAQYQVLVELAEKVWRNSPPDFIWHRAPLAHVNESIAKARSSEGIHALIEF